MKEDMVKLQTDSNNCAYLQKRPFFYGFSVVFSSLLRRLFFFSIPKTIEICRQVPMVGGGDYLHLLDSRDEYFWGVAFGGGFA